MDREEFRAALWQEWLDQYKLEYGVKRGEHWSINHPPSEMLDKVRAEINAKVAARFDDDG